MTKREKEYLDRMVEELQDKRNKIEKQICCLNNQSECSDEDWMSGMTRVFSLAQDAQINQALLIQALSIQAMFETFKHEEEKE